MSERNEALKRECAQLDQEVAAANMPPALEPSAEPGTEPGPAAPPEPVLSPVEETRGGIDMLVEIAIPFYPSLGAIYSPEVRDRLARVLTPVLRKYNVSIGDLAKRWKEEIDLAFVALPLMIATVRAVKIENAIRAREQAAAAEREKEAGRQGASSRPANAPASPEPLYSS